MDFIKRHRLLLAILSFVLMALPQSIEAIWSLVERIGETNIVMPEISIVWFTWITVPVGLIMLGFIIWQTRRKVFRFEYASFSLETRESVLMLNLNFFAMPKVKVENIQLETEGQSFSPLDWQPFEVEYQHTHQLSFNMSAIRESVSSGQHNFKFVATIDRGEHESHSFSYTV